MKGIAGFYYVHVPQKGIYECKAKGIFRNQNVKPLVGDDVGVDVVDVEKKQGNITEILPRKNQLSRPAVANVDQVMAVLSVAHPEPNLYFLDRFLVRIARKGIPIVIGFNKIDIDENFDVEQMSGVYEKSGYPILFFSVKENENLDALRMYLKNKTTVLAGPSGVGKSSLMNYLHPLANMDVGNISNKNKRGKHTTRHTELFFLKEGYLMDTPGFGSLELPDMEKEELKQYIPEFGEHGDACKFMGCVHVNEPGCSVKKAVEEGLIHKTRYQHYLRMFEELNERKRY